MENLTAPPPDCIPSTRMTLSFAPFRGSGTRPQSPHHAATPGYAIDRRTPFAMACRRTARNCAVWFFPLLGWSIGDVTSTIKSSLSLSWNCR
jgi:hypothetical protein